MSLVSVKCLLFIAIVMVVYFFIVPKKYQYVVLLVASYVFYIWSDLRIPIFLMSSTILVYVCGIMISKIYEKQAEAVKNGPYDYSAEKKRKALTHYQKRRKRILLAGLLINFGILAVVKYYGFIAVGFNQLLSTFSLGSPIESFNLLIPLGISFYTFQSLGYLIDVYRGKYPAERNLAKFALFVSFFPQIVQGPIGRYDHLTKTLYAPHDFDYERIKYGIQLILWGFFKKLAIGDRANIFVTALLSDTQANPGLGIALGVFAFTVQVYADFSGGIDVARGISQCLGIELSENFRRPYFAVSIQDYWRRWHISLGTWMKDYLLYPITFSKWFSKFSKRSRRLFKGHLGKVLPTCIAMAIVFFVVGIWHGAEWKYIMFGVYNGALIVLGTLFDKRIKLFFLKHPRITADRIGWRIAAVLKTFILVYIGKFFACAGSVFQAFSWLHSVSLSYQYSISPTVAVIRNLSDNLILLIFSTGLLFCVSLAQERGIHIRETLARKSIATRFAVYLVSFTVLLCLTINFGSVKGFIYEQF